MKYTIEDRMTSLRAISIAVIFYITGYAVKLSVLLNDVLQIIIPNHYIRITASLFTALAIATGLLIVSVNGHKKETPYVIACMDAITLLLVFNVLELATFRGVFTTSFLSVFMAFIGYQLISVFVAKYKEVYENKKHAISELQATISELEQTKSDIKQELSEMKELICEHCAQGFGSKNALNAHIGRCKENPKNK